MKVKNDHHSKFSNLSNWNEEAWKAWFFFRLLLFNCLNWKIYCDDHSSLSSTTAVQKWIISYILHIKKNCPLKLMKTYLFRFISSSFRIYNIIKSKPTQTDTTLLDVICCVHLHTLLHVVGNSVAQSLKPVKLLATCKQRQQLPTLLGQQSRELLHPFARIALQSTYRSTTLSTSMFYLFITRKPPKLKQHRNKFNDKVYQKF